MVAEVEALSPIRRVGKPASQLRAADTGQEALKAALGNDVAGDREIAPGGQFDELRRPPSNAAIAP